jgi:hypothetical protein
MEAFLSQEMEQINQDLQYEVLRGPLEDKFKTANQIFEDDSIIKIWPPGCAILAEFRHHAEKIGKFTVREDDVWIITYPKSGEWNGKRSCSICKKIYETGTS